MYNYIYVCIYTYIYTHIYIHTHIYSEYLEALAVRSTLEKVSQFTVSSWHCTEINIHIILEILNLIFSGVMSCIKYVRSYLSGFDYKN
jgi:hypothetical protein